MNALLFLGLTIGADPNLELEKARAAIAVELARLALATPAAPAAGDEKCPGGGVCGDSCKCADKGKCPGSCGVSKPQLTYKEVYDRVAGGERMTVTIGTGGVAGVPPGIPDGVYECFVLNGSPVWQTKQIASTFPAGNCPDGQCPVKPLSYQQTLPQAVYGSCPTTGRVR